MPAKKTARTAKPETKTVEPAPVAMVEKVVPRSMDPADRDAFAARLVARGFRFKGSGPDGDLYEGPENVRPTRYRAGADPGGVAL